MRMVLLIAIKLENKIEMQYLFYKFLKMSHHWLAASIEIWGNNKNYLWVNKLVRDASQTPYECRHRTRRQMRRVIWANTLILSEWILARGWGKLLPNIWDKLGCVIVKNRQSYTLCCHLKKIRKNICNFFKSIFLVRFGTCVSIVWPWVQLKVLESFSDYR